MFELARQHPELLSMEGFLEADTVEEQQALLQGLLSAYESTYDGIIEVQIEALQIDMMQALADKNHELAHELQNQIDVLKKIQSADNIPVETEEVDTWDQLTEAVSNTTEAYELLDEVKQQIDDTGSPELETLMSFRDLVGDEAFAGMFKVDENTGEQVCSTLGLPRNGFPTVMPSRQGCRNLTPRCGHCSQTQTPIPRPLPKIEGNGGFLTTSWSE